MNRFNSIAAQNLLQIQCYIHKHPELQRIRSSTTLSLTNANECCMTGGKWTVLPKSRIDAELFLRRVIIDHQRPMMVSELLSKLMEKNIAFATTNQRLYLQTVLTSNKCSFINFKRAGYWPADIPSAVVDCIDLQAIRRTHALPLVGSQSMKTGSHNLSSQNKNTKPPVWPTIRGPVSSMEWALRKSIQSWTRKSNIKLTLTITSDEGVITTEKWLILTFACAVRHARRLMLRAGRPMLRDEILEQFITSKIGLQSFTQRSSMAGLLRYYMSTADFVNVRSKGYWPAELAIPPSGYDGRGEPS
jgi:hypothetical protein